MKGTPGATWGWEGDQTSGIPLQSQHEEDIKFEETFIHILNSGQPGLAVRPWLKGKKEDFGRNVENCEEWKLSEFGYSTVVVKHTTQEKRDRRSSHSISSIQAGTEDSLCKMFYHLQSLPLITQTGTEMPTRRAEEPSNVEDQTHTVLQSDREVTHTRKAGHTWLLVATSSYTLLKRYQENKNIFLCLSHPNSLHPALFLSTLNHKWAYTQNSPALGGGCPIMHSCIDPSGLNKPRWIWTPSPIMVIWQTQQPHTWNASMSMKYNAPFKTCLSLANSSNVVLNSLWQLECFF